MASKVLTYRESVVDFLQISTGQWVFFWFGVRHFAQNHSASTILQKKKGGE